MRWLSRVWREWRGVSVRLARPGCVWERPVVTAADKKEIRDMRIAAAARVYMERARASRDRVRFLPLEPRL